MELNIQQIRERILHLSHTYDGNSSVCIDEIKNLINLLPKGDYKKFLKGVPDEVRFHPKIFYCLTKNSQLRNLNKIRHLMGTKDNPNHEAINVVIKLIKITTPEEQKELQIKVPQWVLCYIEEERRKNFLLLKERLTQDFLSTDYLHEKNCKQFISRQEYLDLKIKFIKHFIQDQTSIKNVPDLEQSEAICTLNKNVQVVARAGSGKTTTLVSRALFLQKHCKVSPNEILLLAFNRSASKKMEEDLKEQLTDTLPHVMTFHALAYAIVKSPGELCYDNSDGEQDQSQLVQKIIYDYLRDPQIYEQIKTLMMARFKRDWEKIITGGFTREPKEFLRYRRSLPKLALDGRYYKSFGEKTIANFLFEHNLVYAYEREYPWNGISYRPDFSIFPNGSSRVIILEYFGLEGDVDYDLMTSQKRNYWKNNKKFDFLEFTPRDFAGGEKSFSALLKDKIEALGCQCHQLSEEEIWEKVEKRAKSDFSKAIKQFIQRARKQKLSLEDLRHKIASYSSETDIEAQFLGLGVLFFKGYLSSLENEGKEDFDGLMQRASGLIKSGQTKFNRRLGSGDLRQIKFIMIDEYQDFSNLFHDLIESIKEQNPNVNFFCVGDDWQAINGFAGSDLKYFENFEDSFESPCKLYISTNFRSAQPIVSMGNHLMDGLGIAAKSHKVHRGSVREVYLDQFRSSPQEEAQFGDKITPIVLRIINKHIYQQERIVLLARMYSLPWSVAYGEQKYKIDENDLSHFLKRIRSYFPKSFQDLITISTTHSYKGSEAETAILLDVVNGRYPLIHPNWIFYRIFGDTIEDLIDEERRLLYVAITRAMNNLYIITDSNNRSPFLEDIGKKRMPYRLDFNEYPPLPYEVQHIIIRVGGKCGTGSTPTIRIKELLKLDQYDFFRGQTSWKHWYKRFPVQDFHAQNILQSSPWLAQADDIEIRLYDDSKNSDSPEDALGIYQIENGQLKLLYDRISSP